MKCKICHQNEVNNSSGICWACASKINVEELKEDFGEFCIRTGHKLFGTQGVDGSKYNVNFEGKVSLKNY